MLNIDQRFIVHTDYKPVIKFNNKKYPKGIFMRLVNKLHFFHICIQYILRKKNIIVNCLSQIIFNNTHCTPARLVYKLAKEVYLH